MRARLYLLASVLAFCGAGTAWAQQQGCGKSSAQGKGCGAAKTQQVAQGRCGGALTGAASCGGKAKNAAANVPQMSYKAGDRQFCCEKDANDAAKNDTAKIRFVVGDKTFDAKPDAMKAYAKVLDEHLTKMTTVQFAVGDKCVGCPTEAKSLAKQAGDRVRYRLASYTFEDKAKAQSAAKAAQAAAEQVAMTWAVGEKKYECPMTAGDVAKQSGKPLEYCVGKTRTHCKLTAQVELAKAKISEAVKVIAKHADT